MFLANSNAACGRPLDHSDADALSLAACDNVERWLRHCPAHDVTPLHDLPMLAARLGIAHLHIKDEGYRLGLGSFKALGGSYAVLRLALEQASLALGRAIDVSDMAKPDVRNITSNMTFACATDGNHGKSVARGARLVGANAKVFVHSGVSAERIAAIAAHGANIMRVAGSYDDSVAEATALSAQKGWTVVSDTSWPDYERIPSLVMQGYTVMVAEVLRQLPEPPTHVFLQAGVGGFAAAVSGHLHARLGDSMPKVIVVEPARAACLFASAKAGLSVKIPHGEATVMAMLECYEPSRVAWRILSRLANGFMTLEENEAIDAMRQLAFPLTGDPAIVTGESGGTGFAALRQAAATPGLRQDLKITPASRILLFNTEGATDPGLYTQLVGCSPADVLRNTNRRSDESQPS